MERDTFDLSGRVAIVTGASRGIGEAIARRLAASGAHVVVTSRRLEGCQAVEAKIRAEGGSAEARACHIGDLEQIDALVRAVVAEHGRIDVLVNNAAANPYFGHVLDTDVGAYQKTVDVNVRGYFFTSTAVGKVMREQKRGSIVNVASVNAVVPGPMQGIYSITKAAIVAMTKSFAKECAPLGIRVNAVLPGFTDTKFAAALTQDPAIRDTILKLVPMGRIAEPDEMAGVVLYLASDAATYTTGACINVDGGYLA
jgi:NAD(P)-dependent dehydrogenase (short-subunit alcohol dehydrogenase family)